MQRRHDLDWLRVIAFGLLVVYHVGMYYVTWDWQVKSPTTHLMLEPFMLLSGPWRMSLLFLISGAATAFMLERQPRGFLGSRSWRLLLPLVFGMLVVVAPQTYFEIVEKYGYTGSFAHFYELYVTGRLCRGGQCLATPTWNHLWFLPYLWVYTLMAWALWRLLPAAAFEHLRAWTSRALEGWSALLVPVALLAVARLLLVARFEQTHALVDDWYNHAQYLAVFLVGFLAAFAIGFWESLRRLRWVALALAAGCYALMIHTWYFSGYNDANPAPLPLRLVLRVTWAIDQWCAIAALLGFAYRWRDADGPVLRYLTAAVFPLYILHQTVIVVLAHNAKPLNLPPLLEGPLLVLLTFALCFIGYEAIRRAPLLRPLFGLRLNPPRRQPSAAAPRLEA